ncbi:MAG: LysM peptidoglycan-binding domain-containing protein [Lachnotalea sp.]
MIEIIYSKENDKKDEYLRLPKNIRQIGIPDETRKIYIEDYAITFINQFALKCIDEPKAAILVGYTTYNNACEYVFVSGVIEAEEVIIDNENIEFLEKAWTSIYDKIKKYFPNQDVVGWFLSAQAFNGESSDHIIKAHINNFAGSDKVFMKIDPLENEEIFYIFQNGHFFRQMGYYIYYEKNEEMQEYMVQTKELDKEEPIEQVEDHATKSFRTLIQERKEEKHQKKVVTFMYASSTFLIMIVVVIGITMINNYDKMKSMEQTLNAISKVVTQEDEKIASDWYANADNQDSSSAKNDNATNAENNEVVNTESEPEVNQATAESEPEVNHATAESEPEVNQAAAESEGAVQEVEDQTSIPVETVSGDVEKQETTGSVTQINSSEEEMQNTLESSNQEQTDTATSESTATEEQSETVAEPQYYKVQKGDTLAAISLKLYNTKDMIQKISELNNLKNDNKILVGQNLLLP